MKRLLIALALIGLPLLGLASGNPSAKEQSLKEHLSATLMRSKLEHSNKVLEGLTTEDFGTIAKEAQAMRGLTVLERWFRADTPQYKAQLNSFWYANDALAKAADEKNLDGATLAYTQLTISCVNCHKHVRAATK
jgi:hypothetical protein